MKTFFLRLAIALSSASLLTACAVGPNFKRPEVVAASDWNVPSMNTTQRDPGSTPVSASIDPKWWNIFQDTILSSLEERVAKENLDIKLATSRLMQSRDSLNVVSGAALPSLDAKGNYQDQRTTSEGRFDPSGKSGAAAFNHWKAGVDASWELDIWGRVGREIEAATATAEATEDMQRGVLLAALAETARDYIQLRGVQRQRVITQNNLDIARHARDLTKIRLANGVATNLEVAEAMAHVSAIEANLPLLDMQESHLINALSYLVGGQPHTLRTELSVPAAIPQIPALVPIGLPSELARRRPDIRQAEAELHAITARIGIAKADFYPRISLSGNFGFEALQLASFGNWDTRFYGIGPVINLPVFDGGRLRSMLRLRERQQQETAIRYQQVVLKAWNEVDDALTSYRTNQQRNEKLLESAAQNEMALASAQKQYIAGAVDFLNVLSVQKELLGTQQALIQSQTEVALALIGLYKSLGGGWEEVSID